MSLPPVYLDNAATSHPKPEAVYRAVNRSMREIGVNAGRGTYRLSAEAEQVIRRARESLARLFHAPDPDRLVFTANATEAINLAIKGLLCHGDQVITTGMEHNAVWRCLKTMEAAGQIGLLVAPCAKDGSLDPDDLLPLFGPRVRLVAMTHASNVTGTVMPVREVATHAHARGIPLLVDTAQTAGVYPVDVTSLSADLLAFTGHKGLLGPQGTGGLYVGEGIVLRPLKEGGTGRESALERQPDNLPDRYEAGTLNGPGIAGLGAAADFLLAEGVASVRQKELRLIAHALDRLQSIPGVLVHGPRDPALQVGVISFNLKDVSPAEVACVLDEVFGVMVRAGLHCAPQAHRTIGTLDRGTVRIGLGYFNETGDIDRLIEGLARMAEQVKGGRGEHGQGVRGPG